MSIAGLVEYVPWLVLQIPLLFILVYNKVKGIKTLPLLFEFILVLNILDVLTYCFAVWYRYNFNVNHIRSILSLSYFIFQYVYYFWNKKWRRILWIVVSLWFLYSCIDVSRQIMERSLDSGYLVAGLVIIIFLILLYFYDILYVAEYRNVLQESLFYFSLGCLLFSCNFTIFVFIDLLTMTKILNFVQVLHIMGHILFNIFLIRAALCRQKKYGQSSS